MTTKDYEVSVTAGQFVAGKRSPGAGKTMTLSADEAEYALIAGELIDPQAKPARAKKPAPNTTSPNE